MTASTHFIKIADMFVSYGSKSRDCFSPKNVEGSYFSGIEFKSVSGGKIPGLDRTYESKEKIFAFILQTLVSNYADLGISEEQLSQLTSTLEQWLIVQKKLEELRQFGLSTANQLIDHQAVAVLAKIFNDKNYVSSLWQDYLKTRKNLLKVLCSFKNDMVIERYQNYYSQNKQISRVSINWDGVVPKVSIDVAKKIDKLFEAAREKSLGFDDVVKNIGEHNSQKGLTGYVLYINHKSTQGPVEGFINQKGAIVTSILNSILFETPKQAYNFGSRKGFKGECIALEVKMEYARVCEVPPDSQVVAGKFLEEIGIRRSKEEIDQLFPSNSAELESEQKPVKKVSKL